jgi:aspartate aminotransferase
MSVAGAAMPSALPAQPSNSVAAPPPASTRVPASPAAPVSAPVAPFPSPVTPSRLTLAPIPVSATLAANEALARKRVAGETVLPLAFGEAGLPAHPLLTRALAEASAGNTYGPVAGLPELREAAAGYWTRRGTPTGPASVVCGPGSKALLFGLLLAIGADVAVPQPSWVSYAAQASMLGVAPHFVPVPPGEGGVCDAASLAATVTAARAAGRRIGAVVLTLPDNPTGRLARPASVHALCQVAAEHDLIIIADEIYRDLVHDPGHSFASPVLFAPDRTVVTTALSKSLALGGWRIGVARLPGSPIGLALRDRLVGIGSEIWSAPSRPIQQAAALAFDEPPELLERISRSRALHAEVATGVADRFAAAGLLVRAPQAAFYLYPDFAPWREHLRATRGISNGADLATHLLHCYGVGVLPASAFGEEPEVLRVRVATAMLYGETDAQRERALLSDDPVTLPWIAAALDRIEDVLADLAP